MGGGRGREDLSVSFDLLSLVQWSRQLWLGATGAVHYNKGQERLPCFGGVRRPDGDHAFADSSWAQAHVPRTLREA